MSAADEHARLTVSLKSDLALLQALEASSVALAVTELRSALSARIRRHCDDLLPLVATDNYFSARKVEVVSGEPEGSGGAT